MVIQGTYRKTLFFNPEKGQTAFFLRPKEGTCTDMVSPEKPAVTVVGKFCLQQKKMPLSIEGEWKEGDYGPEFHLSSVAPGVGTAQETEDFIGELGVAISPRNIHKIVKVTGPDLFSALNQEGIEESIYQKTQADILSVIGVFQKLRNLKSELELFQYLEKYNGTYEHCSKILKKYPEDAMDMLLNHTYDMDVQIPFKILDQIALDNGVEPLSDERVKAILTWCMKRESGSGSVYINLDDLCKAVGKSYSDIPKSAIIAALADHKYIVKDPEFPNDFYESRMLKDEKMAAKDFARILNSRKELPFHPEFIDKIEADRGFAFGGQQRQAFQLLRSTGFKLLTGDPGTGKTTTVNGLLKYLEMLWDSEYGKSPVFALCAPAGRAAQRMKETTNRNALTIHKLIEYQPYGANEYYKDANDPIEADVIVVDEVSMLGLSTFSKLINAIKNGTLVLLVGDTNQLQSVEPGNVLHDIIASQCVDRCHLSEVFRQAEESLINQNAKKIIRGEEDLLTGDDFQIQKCTKENIQDTLKEVIYQLLLECNDSKKIQALAPVKKGSCGVKEGNVIIQQLFNPDPGGIWYGYRNYKLNDRVIMMSNNYGLQYFNGDVGYITGISDNSMSIQIGEENILLPREQYSDMDLAYTSTVHKSQGSEYDYLVIVLQEEAKGMLDQNLLYTAVTRGKKKVWILYENDALVKSIRTGRKNNRNSHLIERIYKELGITA